MDEYGIVANVESDRPFRTGAKVWVLHIQGNSESARCSGLNKSGRRITKYIQLKRLTNFRAAWMPEDLRCSAPGHVISKDEAVKLSADLEQRWKGVRYYHRNGDLLKAGKTPGQAFAQAGG